MIRSTLTLSRLMPCLGLILVAAAALGAACSDDEEPDATATSTVTATATASAMPSASATASEGGTVDLALVADGLTAPVFLASPADGTDRIFIVEQTGTIRVMSAGRRIAEEPFLDITERLVELDPSYDERGLLGLAFHPDYANNGKFYVYYSAPLAPTAPEGWDHTNRVAEFTVSADNPDVADLASERVVLDVDHPAFNHNGGHITFGDDGYLYVPIGDGGEGNDVGLGHTEGIGNAQDLSNIHGAILRLDVDNPEGDLGYGIPSNNPFIGQEGVAPEIWAYGVRNPYDIGFDSGGEYGLLVADAGQNLFEEVSLAIAGANLGWHVKEGTHCFDPENADVEPDDCADTGASGEALTGPVVEFHRSDFGTTVTGARIYRGSEIPALAGQMVFVDWTAGPSIYVAQPNDERSATSVDEGLWEFHQLDLASEFTPHITGITEGPGGELYILANQESAPVAGAGTVYRLVQLD